MHSAVLKFRLSILGAALAVATVPLGAQSVPVDPDAPADTTTAPPLDYDRGVEDEETVSDSPTRAPLGSAQSSQATPATPLVLPEPLPSWTSAGVEQLLTAISDSHAAGLNPRDYAPDALRSALQSGERARIDAQAGMSFRTLAKDLREGRTPPEERLEWYLTDTDTAIPLDSVMRGALESGDIAGTLARLEPQSADYQALKKALAATPADQGARIARLRANLDRWRWMPRTLGDRHIFVNVPAYKLRLMDAGQVKTEHRVIIGKPQTSTPQLSAMVEGVIFNPSWYIPQSILREGLGAQIRSNPAGVRARGYDWTVGEDGTIWARQKPSPKNALGLVKLDMPNKYAIFIHDTPGKHLFEEEVRAFSHGCMRTDRAMFLAGMISGLYGGKKPEEIGDIVRSGETTKIPVDKAFPVYIAYFTAAAGANGKIAFYDDIYGRDVPLLKRFAPSADAARAAVRSESPPASAKQPELTEEEENLLN